MSVIIKQQDQIEIYRNEDGGISIRQTDSFEGEYITITFQDEHAQAICDAILAIKNAAYDGV
jgi:hypothetical protein